MSAQSVVAVVACLIAFIALIISIRTWRRLVETQLALATTNAALERAEQTTAESVAAVHRSTVEEVTNLLDNLLVQVDTDITAKVGEALAVLRLDPDPGVDGTGHLATGTSSREEHAQ